MMAVVGRNGGRSDRRPTAHVADGLTNPLSLVVDNTDWHLLPVYANQCSLHVITIYIRNWFCTTQTNNLDSVFSLCLFIT